MTGNLYNTLALTKNQARAILEAISQMTDGNARDFDEWEKCTSGTLAEWRALLEGEQRLSAFVRGKHPNASPDLPASAPDLPAATGGSNDR